MDMLFYLCICLFSRLKAATQDSESVRRKQTEWERQVGELQGRCSSLEEEKFEALSRLRNSIQLAEEASLQREQVTLQITTPHGPSAYFVLYLPNFINNNFTNNFVCVYVTVGSAEGETESRRAGEDERRYEAADPGCCLAHQERGDHSQCF